MKRLDEAAAPVFARLGVEPLRPLPNALSDDAVGMILSCAGVDLDSEAAVFACLAEHQIRPSQVANLKRAISAARNHRRTTP